VGGMVGFAAVGVAWGSMCRVCTAIAIALVVCCHSKFVGCSVAGNLVRFVMDGLSVIGSD